MRGDLEAELNCNILTLTLIMAITAFLSHSPGLLNWGLGAQPLWDMFLISASSLQLIWSPTHLNFLSPGWYNNLMPTLLPVSVTISHSIRTLDNQGHILIFFDRMHLLFKMVHFLFWQMGRVGGQYTTYLSLCKLHITITLINAVSKYMWKC